MNARDARQSREMFAVQSFEVGGVGDDDAHDVVVIARHQVALHHFRDLANRFFEAAQIGLVLPVECDVDEHVHRAAGLLLIDQRGVTLDQTRLLERAHAP